MRSIIILLIGALVLFSSCNPCKRLARVCPPTIVRERYDSLIYRDSIIIKDRIVEIKIPADTVYKTKEVPVPYNVYVSPITAENDYARAHAWIEHSKIKLELIQKEQVIQKIIEGAEKETFYWKEKYEKERIVEVKEVKYTPKLVKILSWIGIISIVILLTYIYIIIRKKIRP